MDLQLSGRSALVTGASQGIGRAIATRLAEEGVKVFVAARRTELLDAFAGEMNAEGRSAPGIIAYDLYPDGAAEQLADTVRQRSGGIDILVNAAGGSRPIPFEATKDQWSEGMTLNFWRLRELTHALVPDMVKRGFGRIVNITGTSEPPAFNAASTAKAAVHAWSKGLSREFGKHGITINCLQPGRIRSEQIDRKYPTDEARRAFAEAEIPVGRFGQPTELADLATFLCSPRAGYITGTVIPVDGGMARFAF
jgi:3-oxoacyl-[acyl-carrier protein] reductase